MPRKKKNAKKDKPKKIPKKRGRKPKGGKIVEKNIILTNNVEPPENIILHLKCSKSDLNKENKNKLFTNSGEGEIKSYVVNNNKNNNINFDDYKKPNKFQTKQSGLSETKTNVDINIIWDKIKMLRLQLHNNDVADKRSNCFWCTHHFDNPPIYIPKRIINNEVEVYGCFCSPECAVAHLKNENINTSTLWERYSLLNNIYGKIYNYEKNIKPAPNPFYTLDRFYGNLTIEEYRNQLKNDTLLMVVEKPLTKVMPDMYEENNELPDIYKSILDNNNDSIKSYSLYRNKTTSSKKTILNNNFNNKNNI
jgi:hypothetical protein